MAIEDFTLLSSLGIFAIYSKNLETICHRDGYEQLKTKLVTKAYPMASETQPTPSLTACSSNLRKNWSTPSIIIPGGFIPRDTAAAMAQRSNLCPPTTNI